MMNQIPVRQCRYCGSDDLGLGWQHGEGIVTFKKHGILGALPDLPSLRRGAVPVGGRASMEPHASVRSPVKRKKDVKKSWRS